MKVTVFKNQEKTIAYDENGWYINGVCQPQNDGENIDIFKDSAYNSAYTESQKELINFTTHFKHVAVLTAAGTSMENGSNGGKTRKELWEEYLPEINGINDVLTRAGDYISKHCNEIVKAQNIEDFLSFTILYEKLNGPIKNEEGTYLREDCKSIIVRYAERGCYEKERDY